MTNLKVKDDAGNIMKKHISPIKFICDKCNKIIEKGNVLYQFHYTEPICENCYKLELNNLTSE